MKQIDLRELLEAGCHFGHEVKRWHPKAKTFIYSQKDGIHIIDLIKTKDGLVAASQFAYSQGKQGKKLLFVGTKRQARSVIQTEAKNAGAPYFNQRWVGGFITNWTEIKKSIDKLNKMDKDKAADAWKKFPKHEQLKLDRERLHLEKFYGGVKTLTDHPNALFVIDIRKESAAVAEAVNKGIPVIGIVDTNSNPDMIDYPIPANDDAVKSITIITQIIASSYAEGLMEYQKTQKEAEMKKTEAVKPQVEIKKPAQEVKKEEVKVESKTDKPIKAKKSKKVTNPKEVTNGK